jgi:hypothetical protein
VGRLEQVLGEDCVRVTLKKQHDPNHPRMTTFHWTEVKSLRWD